MPSLAQFQDGDNAFQLMQNSWASQLNPVLQNPSLKNLILRNVTLAIGSNTINHLLGRKLQGWRIIRKRAAADIYDTQDSNPQPALTLLLTSSAIVSCDIEVF